jgi:integrase/recombinase XerD
MVSRGDLPAIVDAGTTELPAILNDGGPAARFAFEEFLHGTIRNAGTRKSYLHAVRTFSEACSARGLDLHRVTPADVARHLDSLSVSPPTRKLHLAALRRFFDALVLRHVIVLNPALSVRTERYQVIEGKTPEITVEHARTLLRSIDTRNIVGLRDYAVIGVLIYTAARVGAVAKLRRKDYYEMAGHFCLRFQEKGGKQRLIPVRHDLQLTLSRYLHAGGMEYADPSAPLFRATVGRTRKVTSTRLSADDIARMLKRRLVDAGLSASLSPHSFRVTTITDLLEQGVPLDEVQYLAGHADPRTTKLYDRRQRKVTRNIVERISI